MTKTLLLLTLFALAGVARAAEYGPIFQWTGNPSTTMEAHWIASQEGEGEGSGGKWLLGEAGFGYGDDDDQTVLKDMKGKYRSVFIRRPYEIPKDAPAGELVLGLRYDDAFIAYLDGKEVARAGVTGAGSEIKKVKLHEADVWEYFKLGTVQPGQKGVIALEGHNEKLQSTDFTLRPRLDLHAKGKEIQIVKEGAKWAYLTGRSPGSGWTKTGGISSGRPDAPLYEAACRPAGDKEARWLRPRVDARPFGSTSHVVHSVSLTGLQPGTRYEFKLAHRGALMGSWIFETAPGTFADGMTFVTGGDMFHTRALLDAMNKRAGEEDPHFALLGGDLAYANGVDSGKWLQWVDSWCKLAVAPDGRSVPMIVAIGNHEVKGVAYRPTNAPSRGQAPYYYSLFAGQENGARTAIDFGNYLSVLTLDSGHTENVESQTEWLAGRLEAREDVPRLFVCYHRPAYGTGVKGDATDIQRQWSPLFEQHKVDAVFENDHHVYKRTHPIRGGKVDENKGVIYMGDGSWGVRTRTIPTNWRKARPWLVQAKALNHLIKVTLTKDAIRYEAMKADGEVIDGTTRPLRR